MQSLIPAAFAAANAPSAVGSFPPKIATTSPCACNKSSAIPIDVSRFPFASCCATMLNPFPLIASVNPFVRSTIEFIVGESRTIISPPFGHFLTKSSPQTLPAL